MSETVYALLDKNARIEIVNCSPEELEAVIAEIGYKVVHYCPLKDWVDLKTIPSKRKDSYVKLHKDKILFEQFKETVLLSTELGSIDSWVFSWGEVFKAQFGYPGSYETICITYNPESKKWSYVHNMPDVKCQKGTGNTIIAASIDHYKLTSGISI